MLIDAIKRAGKNGPSGIRDALAEHQGLRGRDRATITIDEDRNPEKTAVVLEVRGRQSRTRDHDRAHERRAPTRVSSVSFKQLINGLSLGSIYALIALGYTMVYGILKLINFAHGEVFMMGAYAGYYSAGGARRGRATRRAASAFRCMLAVVVLVSPMAGGGAARCQHRALAYRPVRRRRASRR